MTIYVYLFQKNNNKMAVKPCYAQVQFNDFEIVSELWRRHHILTKKNLKTLELNHNKYFDLI